ncbi:hypothetical protein [Psychromonas algicola]|uniref:hypothetical protein n=1 Tax=Psychromonas algicola TaxID=2555642 RepID=UPI001068AF73|nr:hypothetical protein [Psychromonas sp. RZ5]TEW50695.1 hypothetical protein E2R67_08815 [Psychromonas sp. RZ5]
MNEKKTLKKLQKKLKKNKVKKNKASFESPIVEILSLFEDAKKPKNIDINYLDTSDLNIFYKPYKSEACKKCPALKNGMCKCALKKMNKVA